MNENQALTVQRIPRLPALPSHGEVQTMLSLGEQFVKSGLLPNVKTASAALLLIEKGRELDVPPVYALTNIHIVEGKPSVSAEMMLALIFRDHGDDAIHIEETSATRCVISYRRRNASKRGSFTLTMQEMQAATSGRPNWQKYPGAMLRARAISAVARMAFPDTIAGMYQPEELGADVAVDDDGQIIIIDPTPEPARNYDQSTGERAPTPLPQRQPRNAAEAGFANGAALARAASADTDGVTPPSTPTQQAAIYRIGQAKHQRTREQMDETALELFGNPVPALLEAQAKRLIGDLQRVDWTPPVGDDGPPPSDAEALAAVADAEFELIP